MHGEAVAVDEEDGQDWGQHEIGLEFQDPASYVEGCGVTSAFQNGEACVVGLEACVGDEGGRIGEAFVEACSPNSDCIACTRQDNSMDWPTSFGVRASEAALALAV